MGSLRCPLCCQQDFGSVGALRDHLIYSIYRPLQCGVCCLHLESIQEFMHHLKCHIGDGLPAPAKLSCSKPPLPSGGECNVMKSPLPTSITAQETAAADTDAGISSTQLSDGFSNYMKGSDGANQLLKLREWQLEKWGKNFSRHRASFGKSPGVLELSPASGRVHRGSPPVGAKDLVRDRRPSSQNSCYTPRSDVHSVGRSIDSVERFDSSSTPLSVYGNISSVDVSDHSICPQSVGKEVSEDLGLHSLAQPISASYETHSLPSEQTVSSPLKSVSLAVSSESGMPRSSEKTGPELSPKNVNSSVAYDGDVSQQPRSVASPSLYVLSAQEVASCSLPPSRNELQDIQEYSVCATEFAEHSNQSPIVQTSAISIEPYEGSDRLPMLETVDSDNFRTNMCSPNKQFQDLQPIRTHNKEQLQEVTDDREQSQPFTTNKEQHKLVTFNEEQPQQVTMNREHKSVTVNEYSQPTTINRDQHQTVTVYEGQPQPVTVNREFLPPLTHIREQHHTVYEGQPQPVTVNREMLLPLTRIRKQHHTLTLDREERHHAASSGMSDLWVSCSSNNSTTVQKPSEISDELHHQNSSDGDTLIDSHIIDNQDNIRNRNSVHGCWSSNCDEEGSFHTEVTSFMTRSASPGDANLHAADALKGMKRNIHVHDGETTSAFHCPDYESQTAQDGECERLCSSADIKPYLHKKFHHDQERKMLPSSGVDQVADVSQYINSFQSVLVRKLNGTLSTAVTVPSNICSMSMKKPEREMSQECLEQPHQSHQPQAKEHTCEVCHQKYKNLSTLKLHCKQHEKEGEDTGNKNLYKECPKDPPEGKRRKKEIFHCDKCSKVFPKAFNFARHMREVHAIKKSFMCLQCNKAFSSKRHLQEHGDIHKTEKEYECRHCNHLCYTASGLRTHIQQLHSNLEQRVYCCDVCGEKFAKVYGLKRHKQRKHTQQQLMCHICSKTFSCKEDMNKHSRTHVGVGTVKCDTCDKTFSTSWALQRHSKTHQDSPKNFTCSICSASFTRKDSLLSHVNAHSQKKPYVCHCGKRYVKKSQLREHQDKHSSVPKYTCPVCKHSFKFKVSLKNHSCKKKEN